MKEVIIIRGQKAISRHCLKNYPGKYIYGVRIFNKIYYCGDLLQEVLRGSKQDAYLDAGVPKFSYNGIKWEGI